MGTPPLPNGSADLSAIDHVARLGATEARTPKLVIEKSTVPAQTGQELKRALAVYGRKSGVTFRVASNPEFLREGTAVEDFLHPDRIVVGVEDEVAEEQLKEIYRPVLERTFKCPVHSGKCPDVPLPAWLVVAAYAVIELFFGVTARQQSVAHFAHLGGMLGGILCILYWRARGRFSS